MLSAVQPLGSYEYALFTLGIALLSILYYVCLFTYNIYFHPLSKFPGPRIASASPWWLGLSYARGTTPKDLLELHNQYGPVVRISPNGLSFIDPSQWKEIYGHKPSGQVEFSKDEKYQCITQLREQESVIQQYVALLFQRLHEASQEGTVAVDVLSWFNVTFGEPFDCLNNSKIHKWIEIFFSSVKILAVSQAIARFPLPIQTPLKLRAIPKSIKTDNNTLKQLNAKVKHRVGYESDVPDHLVTVPDFMDKLIEAYKLGKMPFGQLEGNASVLIGASSETTATFLSGLTYLLMKNHRVLQGLTKEIRETFQNAEDITFSRVNHCKYLLACIEEALRVYPPSPQPHQRIVPASGATINGNYLPGGVAVAIPIYAACRSARNWSQPDFFIPERWLGEDPQFDGDKKDASQPFSFGPRNCIGRNLAYVEMKIIMARLMWHFDIESAAEGDWLDQKVYLICEKGYLWVKLRPVSRI
ncbi:cytochrome P450 [Jackrogersella minutella]|nr:cytochrome P450 [Jackrogersella minutella]